MPKAPNPLAEFVRDQLRDWAPITARRLFGGWGIYNGPVMFGLIARDTIYFRTDDGNRRDYDAAGMPPFRHAMPTGKVIDMAYSEVPAAVLEDVEEVMRWARKAHEAALRAARAKTATKKSKLQPARRRRGR
jgi:DNA transformation protein and related proteins